VCGHLGERVADGDPVTGIAVITSNADGGYTISGHAGVNGLTI
jgi:hypothetical protein